MKKTIGILALLCAGSANAGVIYNEAINGDAGGAGLNGMVAGTQLGTLAIGQSSVLGSTPGYSDEDWFKFTVAAGSILDSIILTSFSGGGNLGWANGLNIFTNYRGPLNSSLVGTDLLESYAFSNVADQLGEGSYAIKLGTGTNRNTYGFTFNVSSIQVPEPGNLALFTLGLAGLVFSRVRKSA